MTNANPANSEAAIGFRRLPWHLRQNITEKMSLNSIVRFCSTSKGMQSAHLRKKDNRCMNVALIKLHCALWEVQKVYEEEGAQPDKRFFIQFDKENKPLGEHADSPISLHADQLGVWVTAQPCLDGVKEQMVNKKVTAKELVIYHRGCPPSGVLELLKLCGADTLNFSNPEICLEPEFKQVKKFISNVLSWQPDQILQLCTPHIELGASIIHINAFSQMIEEWTQAKRNIEFMDISFYGSSIKDDLSVLFRDLGTRKLTNYMKIHRRLPLPETVRRGNTIPHFIQQAGTGKVAVLMHNITFNSMVFIEVPTDCISLMRQRKCDRNQFLKVNRQRKRSRA